jgi:hypothetical protein
MTTMDLLNEKEYPENFNYPHQFLRIVELGLIDLEPWYLLDGKALRDTLSGLSIRYPERRLIPFARRQDNDDIACWEAEAITVYIIHDFASPGWEQRAQFVSFYSWLRQAVEDLIEFDN